MLSVKKLFIFIHLIFLLILVPVGAFAWFLGQGPGSFFFLIFMGVACLLTGAILVLDLFLLSVQDVLTPFLARDVHALYQALSVRLFHEHRFSSWAINYYLLTCLKLGYAWQLKELEILVRAKDAHRLPEFAHFFSLHYLASESAEDSKAWYLATFTYRNLRKKNRLHFDYMFKVLSLNEMPAAMEQLCWLLKRPLDPYLALLCVYFSHTVLIKAPEESAGLACLRKALPRQEKFIIKKRVYLQNMIKNRQEGKVDVHFLLLENVAKQAMEWLKSWTVRSQV